jgi:hypothetical protein
MSPSPGISFLAPRVAKWRYTRGTRLLADSLGKGGEQQGAQKPVENGKNLKNVGSVEEEDEEGYEIPDEIEDVLEVLFRGQLQLLYIYFVLCVV